MSTMRARQKTHPLALRQMVRHNSTFELAPTPKNVFSASCKRRGKPKCRPPLEDNDAPEADLPAACWPGAMRLAQECAASNP